MPSAASLEPQVFRRLISEQKFMGYFYQQTVHDPQSNSARSCYFFFGSRHTGREDLLRLFPQYKFCLLKQVHGTNAIQADLGRSGGVAHGVEADAHYTNQADLALVVQSADCLPILISSPTSVCAIHAGWRGVAKNIVGATAQRLNLNPAFVAIGPHIRPSNFEIGNEVRDQLGQSVPDGDRWMKPGEQPGKFLFDLEGALRRQIQMALDHRTVIASCADDTMTNSEFHSYRRDHASAGRQFSFVVINSLKPV